MTDNLPSSAAADLAYLKSVAAAGRGRPAPAVPLMAVFGGGFGLGELVVWFEQVAFNGGEFFDGPAPGVWDTVNGVLFIGAHLAFLLTLLWTGWRVLQTRGAGMNRGAAAAWTAAFAGLMVTVASVWLIGRAPYQGHPDTVGHLAPTVVLTLWGCAWWVTSIVTGRRWLGLVAVSSGVMALLAAALVDTGWLKLISASSLLGLAFLPAVMLLWQARRR